MDPLHRVFSPAFAGMTEKNKKGIKIIKHVFFGYWQLAISSFVLTILFILLFSLFSLFHYFSFPLRLKSIFTKIYCFITQCFFDAEELIVLCNTISS